MNSNILQGKWKQLKGNIKETFGKLTDDDLTQAEGSADKLLGVLQERYGYTKAQAQAEWDKFVQKHSSEVEDAKANLDASAKEITAAAAAAKKSMWG
ncbi:MAG: CsbD family protein [Caldilineaceae bacterium]|nr:CsbD family protein [Caldilineaceae bacterium]RIK40731.1 MAG: CsbD family protein [Chloroflexota bacterium]